MVLENKAAQGVLHDSSTQTLNRRPAEAAAALAQALLMCQHLQMNHLQKDSVLAIFHQLTGTFWKPPSQ